MSVFGKRSKYRNTRVKLDGKTFDSKHEATRWLKLKAMQQAGEIKDLRHHARYPLIVNGEKVAHYESDFDYALPTGQRVVEDAKSSFTRMLPMYRLKKKLMLACWGIEIVEV